MSDLPFMKFTDYTATMLGKHLTPRQVETLAGYVARQLAGPKPQHVTQGQVRKQAQALAKATDELFAMIADSTIAEALDRLGRSTSPALRLGALGEQLIALSRACESISEAAEDLPERGDGPDYLARNVAAFVLSLMHAAGTDIGTGETGPAVECLAAVFGDAGIRADPRRQVRFWAKRPARRKA